MTSIKSVLNNVLNKRHCSANKEDFINQMEMNLPPINCSLRVSMTR